MAFAVRRVIAVLRMFDSAKAREFYVDYLGMTVDWEHRFEPDLPLYMQVSRDGLVLHLSEHHGDGTPGSVVYCEVDDVAGLHTELTAKNYGYLRPGLDPDGPGGLTMCLTDPFGNEIRLAQPNS